MKVKLSRILSVVLSLILVVSCIVPALQFSTAAAEAEDAIEEIKTAWSALNVPSAKSVIFGSFYDKRTGGWSENENAASQVINGDEVKVLTPTNASLIIMAPTTAIGAPAVLINIDKYEEIYLYYKNTTGAEKGGIQCAVAQPEQQIADGGIVVSLPATEGNEFVKFDIKAALAEKDTNDNLGKYNGTKDNKFWARFHFGNNNALGLEISQIMGISKAINYVDPIPSDETTADWDLFDWYKAASELDTSAVESEAALNDFNTAVENAKNTLWNTDEGKVQLIVDAISEITWEDEQVTATMHDKCTGAWKLTSEVHADAITSTMIENKAIKYVDFTKCNTGVKLITAKLNDSNNVNSPLPVDTDDWETMYVYYKSVADKEIPLQLVGTVDNGGGSIVVSALLFPKIKSQDSESFVKLDLLAMPNFAETFNGDNGESDSGKHGFGRIQINGTPDLLAMSHIYGKKTAKAKLGFSLEEAAAMPLETLVDRAKNLDYASLGNTAALQALLVYFEAGPEVDAVKDAWKDLVATNTDAGAFPSDGESAAWDLGQWYVAADAVDLTKYPDSEAKTAFEEMLATTKATLLSTDKGIAQLIKATWLTVKPKPYTLLNYWYDKSSGGWTKIAEGKTNDYLSSKVEMDGKEWLVMDPTNCKSSLINMGPWSGNNINQTQTPFDIDDYSEMYFYYKSEEDYSGVQLAYCKPDGGAKSASSYTLPAAADWTKFDLKSQLISMGVNNYNGENGYFMRMHFGSGVPTKARLTSIIAVNTWEKEFGINLNETSNWTSSEWIVRASDFDFTQYEGGADFQELINYLGSLDMNLIGHVPVTANRVDATGNRTAIATSEFGVSQSKLLYDDLYETPINLARNGKSVEFAYNLAKAQNIATVGINTLTPNVKHFKVYASIAEPALWEESSLIYEYKAEEGAELKTEMLHTLSEVTKMRYIRFVILDADDTLDITEIQVRGSRKQEMLYKSLLNSSVTKFSIFTQDKTTNKDNYKVVPYDANRIGSNQNQLKFENITDKNVDTVYDFMIGSKNKESFNMLLDLGGQSAVDKISLVNGSDEKYFPSKMNIYVSNDADEVLSVNATPTFSYTEATEDGVYEAEFLAKAAQYVRIEIVDNNCDYYDDYILTVISELGIYGLDVSGNVTGDAVATFKDSATNITAEVLALNGKDVYDDVNSLVVTQRDLTVGEKAAIDAYGMHINGKLYKISLLDYKGKTMTDIGGRKLRISIPIPDGIAFDAAYWGTFENGEFSILEHTAEEIDGVWYMQFEYTSLDNLLVGVAVYNAYQDEIIQEPEEEKPVDNLNNNQNVPVVDNNDDNYYVPEEQPVEEETETQTSTERVKKYYKVKKDTDGGFPIWAWFAIGGGVVVLAGAAAAVIIVLKKKKNS